MNDDLKAAIEAVGFHKFHFDGVGRGEEFATVLALAEIGRLAVECKYLCVHGTEFKWQAALAERSAAIDAFLASRKGYQAYTPTNPSS